MSREAERVCVLVCPMTILFPLLRQSTISNSYSVVPLFLLSWSGIGRDHCRGSGKPDSLARAEIYGTLSHHGHLPFSPFFPL